MCDSRATTGSNLPSYRCSAVALSIDVALSLQEFIDIARREQGQGLEPYRMGRGVSHRSVAGTVKFGPI